MLGARRPLKDKFLVLLREESPFGERGKARLITLLLRLSEGARFEDGVRMVDEEEEDEEG